MKKILSVLALVASASMAMAAFLPITNITFTTVATVPEQYLLTTLTAAGTVYTTSPFGTGSTNIASGVTTETDGVPTGNLSLMDDVNVNNLAAGMNSATRTVLFGGLPFTNRNGSLPDFFLFEGSGGNPDDISIAAIFEGPTDAAADDILGVNVVAPTTYANGWGDTGFNIGVGAPQEGQDIAGLCWDITDLKDAGGVNLASSAIIKGVAITVAFANIDPLAFLATTLPSGIDHFTVTNNAGAPQLVGVPFDVGIIAQDPSNVTVDNSFSIVKMTAAGTLMEFDWNQDGTYGDISGKLTNGVAVIKARNRRAETTASGVVASAGSATTVSAPSVTTIADAFSQLQVLVPGETAAPGTGTGKAGAPTVQGVGGSFNITVNAVDLYWNFLAAAPGDMISIFSTNTPTPFNPVADAPLAAGTVGFSITFTNNDPGYVLFATNVSNGLITNGVSTPINSSQSLVWKGDGGSGGSNYWDVLTTANWVNALAEVKQYNSGNFVTFDDTGSYSPAINIVGTNAPLSVILNTVNNVTFITTNNGGLVGSARLQKLNTGNLRIANTNAYTGGTVITDGALIVANANGVPNSGALIFTNATLLLEADLVHSSGSTRIVGISGGLGGTFTIAAVGGNRAVTLNGVTWGGTTTSLFPGELGTSLILGRASDNTTLEFKSQITLSGGGLGGDRTIVVADGSQAVDVLFSGRFDDASANPANLIKTGAGTMVLTANNNNYAGTTAIEGKLIIASTGANAWGGNTRDVDLGNGNSLDATLQLGDATRGATGVNIGALTATGSGLRKVVGGHPVTNTIITFSTNAATGPSSSTLSVPLGGAGANENQLGLTKNIAGYTLTLDAVNTYTGPTTISGGTLALGTGSINGTTNIDVQAGATFDVSAGSFTLGAGKTLRGGGAVNGNANANGIVTPGSTGIGTLTFSNNLTLGASAALVMEINTTPANDNLTVLGALTGGGTLTVTNLGNTYSLSNGVTYQLFNVAVSGFSSVTLPATPPYLAWNNQLAVNGSIALVNVATPAPAIITNSVSGGNLTLDWPANVGWTLQRQINPITVGIAANWVNLNGVVPPYTVPLSPTNATVFYRLWFPDFP